MTTRKGPERGDGSTNSAKTGNGRMIAYGLVALAVVLFILGLTEGGGGLAIHPMDQFRSSRSSATVPVHWYTPTNVTLWMALAVLVHRR
jgi:F-type H+-transporting ATPase subunit a